MNIWTLHDDQDIMDNACLQLCFENGIGVPRILHTKPSSKQLSQIA